MALLDEIADEVFSEEQPRPAATGAAGGGGLDEIADEVFEGKTPPEKPGLLSRTASAVTSAVTGAAAPMAQAAKVLGFKTAGPAVSPDIGRAPKSPAFPRIQTAEDLKPSRSSAAIPEPITAAPTPPVPVKLGPVPGLAPVVEEAKKAPLLEQIAGVSPSRQTPPVEEAPAPGGMLGRVAAKAGLVDPEAARRRAAEAEFEASSVMTKPEGVSEEWWQFQQALKQTRRTLNAMPEQLTNRALLGIPQTVKDIFGFSSPKARAPQTTAESLTGGAGDLAGFIAGPAKVAHGVMAGNVSKWLAPQAGDAVAAIMAKNIANQSAVLAVASGLAHVGEAGQAESLADAYRQMGEHVVGGALLGAAFGGMQGVIPGNALLPRAARLGVGLSVLDAVQGTRPWDDRELAQKAFDYGLNVYFLWKGQDPRQVQAVLEAEAKARGKDVTPEQVLKSALDKAKERAAAIPGDLPEPTRQAELERTLKGVFAEEVGDVASGTTATELRTAREVAEQKTGGPVERRQAAAEPVEMILAAGPRPAPATPRPTPRPAPPAPAGTPTGPIRLFGPTGRPLEAPTAPIEPLPTAQERAEQRAKGITRPAPAAPQAAPTAATTRPIPPKAAERPTSALSFKDYVEVAGKKWPLTARDPDYARLRFEFDDMRKGLYEARPAGDGRWAVINRKTGEEVDHLQTGAKAQLEANRLNSVLTLDAWRMAQVPAPLKMVLQQAPKVDLAAKPAPTEKVKPGTPAAAAAEAEKATVEGPKPSAEPPAPAKVPTPPVTRFLAGKAQEIRVPAGSRYQIRYEVIPAEDMIPSHHPKTFAKDPRYPEGVQNRPYHSDKSEQAKVIRQGQDFEPLFLVSPQPSSGGTPIVAPDSNVVLSGNSRTMTLLRTLGTKDFDRYREALSEIAPALGIRAEDLAKIENPVLVRRLVGTDTTPEFYRRFAKETNEGFKQALNAQAAAVSQGQAVKPETMEWIAGQVDALGEAASLRDFLRSGRDREIIRRFINDGVFTDRDLNRYIDPRTSQMNEDGKRLVERAILGNAIPDPDLLAQAPTSVVAKIERALGALSKIKGRGGEWDLGKDLEDAVRTVVQVQASEAGSVGALRRQASLLEAAGPSERSDVLADSLLRMKPNEFKAALGRYADEAQRDVRGQETLGFAKPEDPASAFRKAFGEVAGELLRAAERGRDYRTGAPIGEPSGPSPTEASRAGRAGGESMKSPISAPPLVQADPSQVSMTAPPSGSGRNLETAPSHQIISMATTSKPSLTQPTSRIQELLQVAERAKPGFQGVLEDLVSNIPGAAFLGARVKALDKAVEKLQRKTGRDANSFHDYLGGRIQANTPETLTRVAEAIRTRFGERVEDDFLDFPNRWGYRAIHFGVKTPSGLIAEIQLVPEPIADYQAGPGHSIYARWRTSVPETTADLQRMLADQTESRVKYGEAYEQWRGERGQVAERETPYGRKREPEPEIPDYDLPPVSLAEVVEAGGARGVGRAATGLMMRVVGGVAERPTSYEAANPPFFSALAKTLDQKMPERATPEQIAAIAKSPGVKADEVKWTGLDDWLAEQKGPVTKAQVQAFLRDNAVRVEETVLGGATETEQAKAARTTYDAAETERAALNRELGQVLRDKGVSQLHISNILMSPNTAASQYLERGMWPGSSDRAPKAIVDLAKRYWDAFNRTVEANRTLEAAKGGAPKFGKYTLPGGQNYRELLLTLPARPGQPAFDPAKVEIKRDLRSQTQGSTSIWYEGKRLASYGDDPQLQPGGGYKQRPDDYWMGVAKDLFEKGDARNAIKSLSGGYRSPHWDEPNILASVRFNDRVDRDGKRVLFLEEIQSDWHQEGRRKGYQPIAADMAAAQRQIDVLDAKLDALHERGDINTDPALNREYNEMMPERIRLQMIANGRGEVPAAPFAKTWHELAFKRMLRWAAEHGYDRLAWTTGAQQAERYDLSKQIDTLRYEKGKDGAYELFAEKNGATVLEKSGIKPDALPDWVGKDVADRILRDEGVKGDDNGRFLTGLGLKVGGEGMKGFYDKILPEFAAKYGKKWGATVGETALRTDNAPPDVVARYADQPDHPFTKRQWATVHAMDVTPEMRRSVLIEGQALFDKDGPYGASSVKARKGATTADRESAQLALFDLEQTGKQPQETVANKLRGEEAGAGVRTTQRMIDAIKDKGFLDFRGQTIESARDLAVLGQMLRDPRYETFRVFYLKGDEVVSMEAMTSRLPGTARFYEGKPGVGKEQRRTYEMRDRMRRLGADGYYLLHNHPSGRPEPSREDMRSTEDIAAAVPGFRGHVVIDSGQYGLIEVKPAGQMTMAASPLELRQVGAPVAVESVHELPGRGRARVTEQHMKDDEYLSKIRHEITNPEQLAFFGKTLQVPDNYVGLVYRDSASYVRAVQEMPRGLFLKPKEAANFMRGQQRVFGARDVMAWFKPDAGTLRQAKEYVATGVLMDAMAPGWTGAESLRAAGGFIRPRESTGQLRGIRVQEEGEPYGAFDRLPDEARKQLVEYGRGVLKGGKTDFASWAKEIRDKVGGRVGEALPGAWAELMQEVVRTQAKAGVKVGEVPRRGGKPPEPPKDIPRSAPPIDPPPSMTEPQLKLGLHKEVVDAAEALFRAGKIERDPKVLISDQILEAIRDGKLRIEDMARVLDERGMTFAEFGASMFRPAITDAAKRLGALGQLQRRLNELESALKREADTPGPDGKPGKPGGPDPAKLKTIGDILDAARVLDPKGDKIRNRTMAAALAYWRRADNVRRGLLVTQLATSVRNFTSQVGRLGLDVMDQGLEGGLQRAFGKEVTAHPADSMKAMMDVFRVSPAEAKRRVDALLEGLPREEERLFSNYASDLNRMAKKQGADKAIDTGLRGAEKAVEVLNTFNRFQEYVVRRSVFQAELGARLRKRGIDLEAAIKDPTIRREIPVADIRAAIEKSLEITFASNPAYGSAGYHFIKWINKTPGATFLIPFPRFMMNALKFYLEFSPAGFLKFLSEAERQKFRQGDMKTMSRSLLGVGLLSAAYLIRSMQEEDTKWNEVRLPGLERTIDVRPLNPFASYLFVADVLRRYANGNLYGGGLATEAVKNILGVNVRGGTGLQAVDQLVDGLRDIGDAKQLTKYLQGAGGHLVAGLLTPLQQLTDVYAEFDPEAQIVRNVRERPFAGPILQRFPSPMVERLGIELPSEKARPTSSEPMRRESPGVRQATGLTMFTAKNDFEKELDRLQIPYREVLPSQGDARLDNFIAKYMGEQAETGNRIVTSARYQRLGEIGKRLELKAYLQRLRKKAKAKAMLDRDYRDIAREVKAGTSKERLAEIAREERGGLR